MRLAIALLTLSLFLNSCKNNTETVLEEPETDSSVIFGKPGISFPKLSAPVQEQVLHWGGLEDFFTEAKNVNGSNFESLRNTSESLEQYTDSLFSKIPVTLDTKAIHSRLKVIKTRTALLYQTAHLTRVDSAKIQNSIAELNMAITNFIVQLNGKYQKDRIDLNRKENEENELKKQKNSRDSIFELERKDKDRKKL